MNGAMPSVADNKCSRTRRPVLAGCRIETNVPRAIGSSWCYGHAIERGGCEARIRMAGYGETNIDRRRHGDCFGAYDRPASAIG